MVHPGRFNPNPLTQGADVKPHQLSAHLRKDHYGDFWLTEAIRPAPHLPVIPRQGYRLETYRDPSAGFSVPVLMASISREHLFDVFLDLLDPLGEEVDVVLETSHRGKGSAHQDLFRELIDLPVLKSYCCDFEELLMQDGCTGIAVLSTIGPMEVQFDEHKLLIVYAADLTPFTDMLDQHGIERDDSMAVITEGEHLHSTNPSHRAVFERFCHRIGVGEPVQSVSW